MGFGRGKVWARFEAVNKESKAPDLTLASLLTLIQRRQELLKSFYSKGQSGRAVSLNHGGGSFQCHELGSTSVDEQKTFLPAS